MSINKTDLQLDVSKNLDLINQKIEASLKGANRQRDDVQATRRDYIFANEAMYPMIKGFHVDTYHPTGFALPTRGGSGTRLSSY